MDLTRFACLCAAVLAAGCAQPDAPAAESAAEPARSGAVKPVAGKPSAPVEVTFAQEGAPQAGVALALEVIAMPTVPVDRLALAVSVSQGLDFVPAEWESGPLEAGAVVKRPLKVTPRGDGEFYVRVEATSWVGDRREVKVAVHGITVGKPAAKPSDGKARVTPQGERVISMPATEPPKPR